MQGCQVLLFQGLGGNRAYPLVTIRGVDRVGVVAIILIAHAVLGHKLGWQQTGLVAQRFKSAAPVRSTGTGFHHNQPTRCLGVTEETFELASGQGALLQALARVAEAVYLKLLFGQIDAMDVHTCRNGISIHDGLLLLVSTVTLTQNTLLGT
ncbi:hypothetical protein D3C80_1581700 [compost metagenome]